ncbi:hypothetical protein AMJ85_10735 [candidate division BRC1 bacterium SM23_51]|nr:MAG: hypothetical protein AMJ85_10735 [candidate division BRC1 bacterium SM23_51]
MTVTLYEPIQVGPNAWRLSWSSDQDDPDYRVYVNGEYRLTTRSNTTVLTLGAVESAVVDVFDDETSRPSPAASAYVVLGWDAVADADYYRIERKIDGAWRLLANVDAGDQARCHYTTPALADTVAAREFRVTVVDDRGAESTPQSVDILMRRHPDPPRVEMAFNNTTKKVAVTAI